jgi:hypothetical protein
VCSVLLGVVNVITEALAIELTKNLLINGQDEKPKEYWTHYNDEFVSVKLSDNRVLVFNCVEVEHAKLMLKSRGEKK